MAHFEFKLDGVLRHRKTLEQQRQRELSVLLARMQKLQAELTALDQDVQRVTNDVRDNHLRGRLDVLFIAAHRRYVLAMQRKAMSIAADMAALQVQVNKARAELAAEARRRMVLEKLRDRYFQRWVAEMNRKEMAEMDDISMRLGYWRDGGDE